MKMMDQSPLEFISDRNGILNVLARSKEQGIAVGINSRMLGPGTYITAVEDIMLENDIVIVLKSFDATGHMLERNKLSLADIQSVLPFNSVFENPYLKSTSFNKSNVG